MTPRWVWFIWEDDRMVDQAFSREEAEELVRLNPERKLIIGNPVFV